MPSSAVAGSPAPETALPEGRTEVEYDDDGDDELGFDPTEVSEPPTDSAPSQESAQDTGPVRDSSGRFAKREQDTAAETDTVIEDEPVQEQIQEIAGAEQAGNIDEALIARAGDYGLTADQAKSFGDEQLRMFMAAYDRKVAEWGLRQLDTEQPVQQQEPQQTQQQAWQQQQVQQPAQAQPTAQQQAQFQAKFLQPFEKPQIALDPEVWDEQQIAAFNTLNDTYHQQVQQQQQYLDAAIQAIALQHEQLSQFTSQSQAEQEARLEQDMNTWFDAKANEASEWKDEFGQGPTAALPNDSPYLANRQKLARQMRGLATSDGKPISLDNLSSLRDRAFGSLYYDKAKSHARKEILAKVAKRNTQTLNRAQAAPGRPQNGDERARQWVRSFTAQHDDGDDDEVGL